jgi:spoIIIJ-associated protein
MPQRATLETIAPSVEEAIQKGLEELGLNREEVQVEILDEGGSGLFGLGSRQARVRLTMASAPSEASPVKGMITGPIPEWTPELENTAAIAKATISELLEHMGVRADVEAGLGLSDEQDDSPPIHMNIVGGDLSILIGPRAETLNSLQLITRMIVGKEIGHSAHLVVDVSGYRQRREDNLRTLAERMARQALSTGRRQTLEPMTPAERRIIHLALREFEGVATESIGVDPKRKVVIIPVQVDGP